MNIPSSSSLKQAPKASKEPLEATPVLAISDEEEIPLQTGQASDYKGEFAIVVPTPVEKPAEKLTKKWPSLLMKLMNETVCDEWSDVMQRMETHPHEITICGRNGGMNALHAACVRYPPIHIVSQMVLLRPEAALHQNFCGETPLHLASYSASEEVQALLAHAAPQAANCVDQYGDAPLHFCARQGATFPLVEIMLQACPAAISKRNHRGVTPFWLLPRSYLEAESLDEILEPDHDDEDDDDDEEEDEGSASYQADWNLMVLFLRYAYYGADNESAPRADTFCETPVYDWLVPAAASTPACPKEVLRFLCRIFPQQALQYDKDGCTPLILACQRVEFKEPEEWDENEDGFREEVDVVEGDIQRDQVAPEDRRLSTGDTDFIHTISLQTEEDSQEQSVIEILLEWSPQSAFVPDRRQGQLPLVHAIMARQPWNKAIRPLVAACPKALEGRDPHGQFLFQVAAQYAPQLDTIFTTVRSMPIQVQMARWSLDGDGENDNAPTGPSPWKKLRG